MGLIHCAKCTFDDANITTEQARSKMRGLSALTESQQQCLKEALRTKRVTALSSDLILFLSIDPASDFSVLKQRVVKLGLMTADEIVKLSLNYLYRSKHQQDSIDKQAENETDFSELTFFDILDIARNADNDKIAAQYRRRALLFHPDKNHEFFDEATIIFKRLGFARDTLLDPYNKLQYEKTIPVKVQTTSTSTIPDQEIIVSGPFAENFLGKVQEKISVRQFGFWVIGPELSGKEMLIEFFLRQYSQEYGSNIFYIDLTNTSEFWLEMQRQLKRFFLIRIKGDNVTGRSLLSSDHNFSGMPIEYPDIDCMLEIIAESMRLLGEKGLVIMKRGHYIQNKLTRRATSNLHIIGISNDSRFRDSIEVDGLSPEEGAKLVSYLTNQADVTSAWEISQFFSGLYVALVMCCRDIVIQRRTLQEYHQQLLCSVGPGLPMSVVRQSFWEQFKPPKFSKFEAKPEKYSYAVALLMILSLTPDQYYLKEKLYQYICAKLSPEGGKSYHIIELDDAYVTLCKSSLLRTSMVLSKTDEYQGHAIGVSYFTSVLVRQHLFGVGRKVAGQVIEESLSSVKELEEIAFSKQPTLA